MDFLLLKTFYSVYNHGSFTEAAKELMLPQPTVSKRIRLLEKELGKELFVRGKRHVELSEAGKNFIPYVIKIANIYNESKTYLNITSGSLRLGSSVSFEMAFLQDKLLQFTGDQSAFQIQALCVRNNDIPDLLDNRHLDIAFSCQPFDNKGLNCSHLSTEPMSLVIASDHPLYDKEEKIDAEYVRQSPFIHYEPLMFLLDRVFHTGKSFLTNDLGWLKRLIIEKHYLSVLPVSLVQREAAFNKIRLIPLHQLEIPPTTIDYYSIYKSTNEIANSLLDLLHRTEDTVQSPPDPALLQDS